MNGPFLNFGKGRRTLLRSFVPKGKTPDYYHRTRKGLGYVSTPIPSASESEGSLYHQAHHHGSQMSVSATSSLSVNMISTSHLKDGDEEMIQSDTDPWIKHLNSLWVFISNNASHPQKIRSPRLTCEMRLILSPSL